MADAGDGTRGVHLIRAGSVLIRPDVRLGRPSLADLAVVAVPQPVDLLRPEDLVAARFSFTNLVFDSVEPGDPPSLVRANRRRPAFLAVTFPPQHIVERAFFRVTTVEVKDPPSPLDVAGTADAPEDPDVGEGSEVPLEEPPVFASAAGPSRLVFRVRDEAISYTVEGLLDAMGRLELSVAPHALPPPAPLVLRPLPELIASGAVDVGALLTRSPVRRRRRTAGSPRRRATSELVVADEIVSFGRMAATSAALAHRFGTASAVGALAAGRVGERLGRDIVGELDPGDLVVRVKPPVPAPPTPHQTAIELPWRLVLSPHERAGWAHSDTVVEHGGRVELWHTRLGRRVTAATDPPTVDERDVNERTLRAVWARDFEELQDEGFGFSTPPLSASFPSADGVQDEPPMPPRLSLNSRDRMMLVHQTSNFHLKRGRAAWPPKVVPTNRLVLSALGGWLDSRVHFPNLPDGGLTIEEWKHRAGLGRDHEVKVVYSGFLLPFGHKASLVKLTERKITPEKAGSPAYLFQRMFIVVREPEKRYGGQVDLGAHGRSDLVNPLATVRILTTVTPDIMPPTNLPGGSGFLFVPYVAGAPFPFKIVAVDREENIVEFRAPLAFMERDRNEQPTLGSSLSHYNGSPTTDAERRMPLAGHGLAFAAKGTKVDDTVLATDALFFDAVVHPNHTSIRQDEPRFLPVLATARAVVPAMSALAGASQTVSVVYPQAYKEKGFAGNAAEVFLKLADKSKLEFGGQSDRSGGLVTPSIDVSGLSRLTGPIGGDIADAIGDGVPATFDPAKFFAGVKAKLFGVVALTDLLDAIGFDPTKVPTFVAQTLDVASTLVTNVKRIGEAATDLAGELGALATNLQSAVTTFVGHLTDLAADPSNPPNLAGDLTAIKTALSLFVDAVDGLDQLPRAQREQVAGVGRRVLDQLDDATVAAGFLVQLAKGELLPEVVTARLDWKTDIPRWPGGPVGQSILSPTDAAGNPVEAGTLTLAVEVQAPTKPGGEPSAIVACSISPFDLRLIGPMTFLILRFEKLEFSVAAGKKPDVNVVFRQTDGIVFAGPLEFVNTLKDIIPFDGFSDPPYLDVTAEGVKAGFDLPIPSLAVGVFSLENISLGAHFRVPFVDESLEVAFNFCTRDNPFRLTVMLFGGGGFFGVTLTPDGVRVLEAAFEFGAAISINFGVASGGVSVMAGIYFKLETVDGNEDATLTGYFRLRGEVDVLGLISASIELYLELTYETATKKAVGRATLTIEVEVLFLSFSVEISCEKKFAGGNADPTFAQQMGLPPGAPPGTVRPWDEYCLAFAA
ncbi:MAG: hypothetical protein ACRD0G_18860 [Acidimicrobiales bacterium]